MVRDEELDLVFISHSKNFFLHFQQQVGILEKIFTEVANAFPQEKLLAYHEQAKGCKISKGNQLEGLPYQVLDLIRDFDPDTGFNIRFLHWWGKGCYVFVTYGKQRKNLNALNQSSPWEGFNFSLSPSPFNYLEIVETPRSIRALDTKALASSEHQLQIWKKIDMNKSAFVMAESLLKLTEDILSYHGD
ncbi:MAG: hypothetical protein ACXIUQ_14130 [Cecembia sp.]